MKQITLARWLLTDGYSSSRGVLSGGDYCQSGSENVLFSLNGKPRAFRGLTVTNPVTGGRQLYNFDNTYASLNDSPSQAIGSVFMIASGKTLGYIGSGAVYLTGSSLSTTASTTPQMRLLRSGIYTGTGTGPYQLGLGQPDAVELAIGTYASGGQVTGQSTLTGKLKGTYSGKITRIRSTTGAESNASTTSVVITASEAGQWARLTFPLADSNGQDRWGIYLTLAGFGSIGPQLFYIEILESDLTATRSLTNVTTAATSPNVTLTSGTFSVNDIGRQITLTGGTGVLAYTGYITSVLSSTTADLSTAPGVGTGASGVVTQAVDGVVRSIPLEWSDADLVGGELAPINNDPPPAGVFGFSLQDVTAIVGCFGDQTDGVSTGSPGNVIAVSRPGFPESYPADTRLFLPEAPTAVIERAADNYAFVFGQNSLCAVTYTGGAKPLDLQLVWNSTGIAKPHNACIADGRLYAMTGNGLVRMGENGLPDRTWTADIQADLESLTPADTVLGYDANSRHLCVMSGSYLWCFNLLTEKWSTKLNLSTLVSPVTGNITSCVTIGGSLKVSVLSLGTVFTLYTFDQGNGSTWKVYTSWSDGGTPDFKNVMTLRGAFEHDVAASDMMFALYGTNQNAEFDLTTPKRTWVQRVINASKSAIRPKKPNMKAVYAFSVYQSATSAGADSAPVELCVEGTVCPIRA